MKKEQVIGRIQGLKEKAVNLQVKLNTIEKKAAYANPDNFEFYKAQIEQALVSMEFAILGLEEAVERTELMAEEGWFKSTEFDFSYYIGKEVSEGSRNVKKKIENIADLFEKAIN